MAKHSALPIRCGNLGSSRKDCVNWQEVNWHLTNGEIARALFVPAPLVRRQRAELGIVAHPRGRPPGKYLLDLSHVDWSLCDAEIARTLGSTRQNVAQLRQVRGFPVPAPFSQRRLTVDWAALDWTRSDRSLARALGVTAPTVAKYRRHHGAAAGPASPVWWDAVDWDLTNVEIGRRTGKSNHAVGRRRKALGLPPSPKGRSQGRYRVLLTSADWSQSDTKIAWTLGMSRQTVKAYRYLLSPPAHGPAKAPAQKARRNTALFSLAEAPGRTKRQGQVCPARAGDKKGPA